MVLFQLGENEAIDRIERPVAVFDIGHIRPSNGSPGPMFGFPFGNIDALLRRCDRHLGVARPRRTHFDPFGEVGDRRGRKFPLLRHPQIGVGVGDREDQPAFFWMPGHDRRAIVAATKQGRAAIET